MNKPFTDYLGKPASTLLQAIPFRNWPFERSVEEDLPEIRIDYSCEEQGLSFSCDEGELIGAIFLTSENLLRNLLGIAPSFGHSDVLDLLGTPSKSGNAKRHPILGAYGRWDRFDTSHNSIHIQYRSEVDRVKMVTLMRSDFVP